MQSQAVTGLVLVAEMGVAHANATSLQEMLFAWSAQTNPGLWQQI
ncbi:MAG TPA: hypothetical protein VNE38_01455 [Ktedonobacteraceae bacterium]|nr:hypothetical protein [Ktedonobacteraceae bacterium]